MGWRWLFKFATKFGAFARRKLQASLTSNTIVLKKNFEKYKNARGWPEIDDCLKILFLRFLNGALPIECWFKTVLWKTWAFCPEDILRPLRKCLPFSGTFFFNCCATAKSQLITTHVVTVIREIKTRFSPSLLNFSIKIFKPEGIRLSAQSLTTSWHRRKCAYTKRIH